MALDVHIPQTHILSKYHNKLLHFSKSMLHLYIHLAFAKFSMIQASASLLINSAAAVVSAFSSWTCQGVSLTNNKFLIVMCFVTPHSLISAQLPYPILITPYNATTSFLVLSNQQITSLLPMFVNYRWKIQFTSNNTV
jgi:hypothetical protein